MCDFKADSKESICEHEKEFHKILNYNCKSCEKTFKFQSELEVHMKAIHRVENANPVKKQYSYAERKQNGFCRFWNHSTCKFFENCKFLHEEAPHCQYQERCRYKPLCQYYHEEMSQNVQGSSFLEQGWTKVNRSKRSQRNPMYQ